MDRDSLQQLLGDLPEDKPISVKTLRQEELDGYSLESLLLNLNGIERVPEPELESRERNVIKRSL
ncbi:hypothetical protein DFP94_102380 [Fontibacillus phaseoli]|uniref:Uncharacterized protein n=1 Tax=Fontibacillus phaseoli TaxID=1416533 RepID=A0A369BKH2_9BACL|nr:hypothetical protein [Fontibacillus phaseoli]RCX21625.1 hypothetical protein DFP94_102380 [Fontibacillus phaseoli]